MEEYFYFQIGFFLIVKIAQIKKIFLGLVIWKEDFLWILSYQLNIETKKNNQGFFSFYIALIRNFI